MHFLFFYRYGENHPMFYIGTLEAASQEAFYGKARDVSMLQPESILNLIWICPFFGPFYYDWGWNKWDTKVCIMLVYPWALMSFPLGLFIKSVFFALRQHRRRETDSAGYYSYTVEGDTKFLVSCPLLLNWWEFQTQTWSHSQFLPQLLSCKKAVNPIL